MKKKLLEGIPIQQVNLKKEKNTYHLYAYVVETANDKILVIDCYFSMNDELTYRIFIAKTDYITLALHEESKKRWKTGAIDSVLGVGYLYGSERKEMKTGDKKSNQIIIDFINETGINTNGTAVQCILRHQNNIGHQRLVQRDRKITDPIDARMNHVPQLPEDFKQFIKEEALYKSRYLFYEYSRRKIKKGYCSWCNTWVRVSDTEHNKQGICPHCQSNVTFKSMRKQKYITDNITIEIMQRAGDNFIIRKFRAARQFRSADNMKKPFEYKDSAYEKERMFFDLDGNTKDSYIWEMFKQREVRWVNQSGFSTEQAVLYMDNLDDILNGTRYQYSGLKRMAQSHHGFEFSAVAFIIAYPSEKYFEYLIKYNLCNVLKDLLKINSYQMYYSCCYRYSGTGQKNLIHADARDIAGLLGIQKYDLKLLQEADANLTGLEFLQYCRNHGIKPVKEMIELIQSVFYESMADIVQFKEYTTIHKAVRYLSSVKRIGDMKKRAQVWKDYIRMCKQLKYDLNNDFVLFPRDLKLRHDQCVDQINYIESEKKRKTANKSNKEISKMYQQVMKQYSFANDKLIIMVPKDAGEIIYEGQSLHHCVGSYVQRVNRKETTILFIRKKEDMDKPFYTMEVKDNKVVQVRGLYNAAMTPDVKGFVKRFETNRLKKAKMKEAV